MLTIINIFVYLFISLLVKLKSIYIGLLIFIISPTLGAMNGDIICSIQEDGLHGIQNIGHREAPHIIITRSI